MVSARTSEAIPIALLKSVLVPCEIGQTPYFLSGKTSKQLSGIAQRAHEGKTKKQRIIIQTAKSKIELVVRGSGQPVT
jgi:hypothetical protein